jgi:hypothetical protein
VGGVATLAGVQPGTLRLSLQMAGTRVEAGHAVDPQQFEPGIPDAEQARRHLLTLSLIDVTIRAEYGLTDRFAVAVRVPVRAVDVVADFEGEGGRPLPDFRSIHHRDEVISGLSDVTVDAIWQLRTPLIYGQFRAGLSLPTGGTEPDPFVRGALGLEHQHIFLGTGTVDPRMGLLVGHAFDGWALELQTSAAGAFYRNDHFYRAGWRFLAEIGAPITLGDWMLRPGFGAYAETPARWRETRAVNSGRTDLLPSLAVNLPWEAWTFGMRIARPINLTAEGGQVQIPIVLGLSVMRDLAF